jgi:hypothetical protein
MLATEPSSDPSLSPSSPSPAPFPSDSLVSKIFLNEKGLRGGWRLLIYAVFVVGLGAGGGAVLLHFLPPTRGVPSPGYFFAQETFGFFVIIAAALIMAQIEHRLPGVYGLPLRGAFGKLFWQGCLIGLIEVSALVGLIAVFGGYSFGSLAVRGAELLRWGLLWAVFFVVVGLFEEFLFRGYIQFTLADATLVEVGVLLAFIAAFEGHSYHQPVKWFAIWAVFVPVVSLVQKFSSGTSRRFTLTDGIGFWPAAFVLSVLFGAVHLSNPGEGWVGAAGVISIGLIFALTLRRTGNLWLAVGWHASFDFGETFLFSVPNSGLVFQGHLSNSSLHGARWLTGGTVGPEGSVFSFLTMGILALAVHLLFPAKKTQSEAGPGANSELMN